MGEIADMMLEHFGDEDDNEESDYLFYLYLSDEDLRAECSTARDKKIINIRNWSRKLSPKQRYCLAVWAAKRDDREYERSMNRLINKQKANKITK